MAAESSVPSYHPLFNDPVADTVVLSREATLFRVPSFVLRRTTGYFAATLPVTLTATAEPVPLDEPAALLARIFSILCGLPPPGPELDFPTAEAVLALAERWSAPGVTARMRDAITGPAFLAEPLRLYAVAARAGWAEEARLASRGTLALGLYDEKHEEGLRRLRTPDLLALLALHRRRRDILDRMLSGEDTEGVNAAAVSGRCAVCGLQTENYAWREYRARIFVEMDTRALGDTVTGSAVDDWREALACWSTKCAGAECGKVLYERETILPQIKACIDKLPKTV
ncbi:hypothetical protein C8F04DRAFT_1101983 [Mycena alexandri]|uniref:BTB domain-containing protein n=1 Tax=Mycena alexandri TaxID=1745969 RepID=A0AAD6SY75_9AGAR|nr:hypothetical protein C8F04DRAFT_1101983 [Mycena alexandri]